ERRRRQGQDWLFPDQKRSAARNRLSGVFTKTFSAYRMAEGLYDPLRPFHSLRTDFNVVMKRAGVPLTPRKEWMGQLVPDVTEVDYDADGDPIAYLNDCVAKIEFDHSGIRRPFAPAADAATSAPRLRLVSAQSR